jgi:hypothetical protein
MAFFRGISLHLWSANGLTAEWHDGHQGPYLRIQDEDGNTCTLHALPEQFRILRGEVVQRRGDHGGRGRVRRGGVRLHL